MIENKCDIYVCMPGSGFTFQWDTAFIKMLGGLSNMGLKWMLGGTEAGNDIFNIRNGCLNPHSFEGQKPIVNCRWVLWIDSDNPPEFPKIKRLLDHDEPIVSGWYKVAPPPGTSTTADDLRVAVGCFEKPDDCFPIRCYTEAELMQLPRNSKGLVDVGFVGFGNLLIKMEVFHNLEYPWFYSWLERYEDAAGRKHVDKINEDVGFCKRVRKLGYKVLVDPECRVGHEKRIMI